MAHVTQGNRRQQTSTPGARVSGATWRVTVNNSLRQTLQAYVCIWPIMYESITSSTKPEVHNVLYCRQRRTKPRAKVTCTENFVKFERALFEICERQTDRHTDRYTDTLIAILRTPLGAKYQCEVTSGQSNLTKGRIAAAHGQYSLYIAIGRPFAPQKCPFLWDICTSI